MIKLGSRSGRLIGRWLVFLDLRVEDANERSSILLEHTQQLRAERIERRKISNLGQVGSADDLLVEDTDLDLQLLLIFEELLQDLRYACRILSANDNGGRTCECSSHIGQT